MKRCILQLLGLSALFAFGFVICFHLGFQMMHPLDQSIVFDGAWRLICGQWFFDGFTTPVGFLPIMVQAFAFHLLGVEWWVYCLHAAIFNGLFVIVVYKLLQILRAEIWISIPVALLSGVLFYPPMATPYPDQHAFFFSLLALTVATKAVFSEGRNVFVWWSAVPVIITCGLLSKHVPTVFVIPAVAVLFGLSVCSGQRAKVLLGTLAGILVSLVCVLLVFGLSVILSDDFWYTMVRLPTELASTRLDDNESLGFKWWRAFYLRPFQVLSKQNFTLSIVHLLPIVFIPLLLFVQRSNETARVNYRWHLSILTVMLGLHLASSQFVDITSNQRENGIPFVFVCVGLALVWLQSEEVQRVVRGRFSKITHGTALFAIGVICIMTWDAFQFNQRVNETRKVLDSEFNSTVGTIGMIKGTGLDGLQYNGPYGTGLLRPDSLILFLRQHSDERFLLFGDMAILNGLTGNRPISPVLWFHPGLTLPDTLSNEFAEFRSSFTSHVIADSPSFVIFERNNRRTYTHLAWNHFPELNIWLEANLIDRRRVGGFDVCRLKVR